MKMHQSIFNKMMTYFYCLTIVSILSLNHRCGANIDFHLDVIEANLSNTNRNILIKKTIGEELSESRSEDDVSVSAGKSHFNYKNLWYFCYNRNSCCKSIFFMRFRYRNGIEIQWKCGLELIPPLDTWQIEIVWIFSYFIFIYSQNGFTIF